MRKKLLKSLIVAGVMMLFPMSVMASEETDLADAKETKQLEIEDVYNNICEEYEGDTYYENVVDNELVYWTEEAKNEVDELTSVDEVENYDAYKYADYVNESFAYYRTIDLLQTTIFEIEQISASSEEEILSAMQLEIQQLVSENVNCVGLTVNTDNMAVYNIVFAVENGENGSFDFTVGVGVTNIGDAIDGKGVIIASTEDTATDEDSTSSDSSSDSDSTIEREEVFTDGVLEYEIGAIAGVSKLTVASDDVTLEFDEDALGSITAAIFAANEANEDYWLYEIFISAVEVDVTTLDEDVQDLVGNRPVFDFSVIATDIYGNSLQITDFGDGSVTVTIPYTLAEGESADNLVIYYISDDGVVETIAIDSYEDGMITFTTTHFSTYAVGYEEGTASDTTGAGVETGDTANVMLYVMITALACGGVVITKRRMA